MAMSVVALSEGDRSVTIPGAGQDEIGDIARALEMIREAGVVCACQTALDCVSTAVMMVNASHKVVYANDRVTQMFADAADDLAPWFLPANALLPVNYSIPSIPRPATHSDAGNRTGGTCRNRSAPF